MKSVCVYCGASTGSDPVYAEAAQTLAATLAASGLRIVYGGAHVGLMGLIADTALAAGAEVVGVIPRVLVDWEVAHTGLTELHVVDSMHTRKRMMFDLSQAFIVLPGGMGTLDETFEIITWRQLGMHDKPIILVNHDNYWDPFLGLVDHVIDNGFARPAARQLFSVVGSVGRLFDLLEASPQTREPSYPERI